MIEYDLTSVIETEAEKNVTINKSKSDGGGMKKITKRDLMKGILDAYLDAYLEKELKVID